ncbi:MAG: pyridoxal 5'-phosphate synthase [Pseudomonadota bacterium]
MNETSDSIIENPIAKFQHWWQLAIVDTPLKHKNPVCVSTIDRDGYPNGRFVDLKTASDTGFVFCTDLDSSKGIELAENPKIALTIWWDHVGFQIRIKGTAKTINKREADNFWSTRLRDAKITTSSFQQSQLLANLNELSEKFETAKTKAGSEEISRPSNWGGFRVIPMEIEFLKFEDSRLHVRELYQRRGLSWDRQLLQP